MTVTREEMVRTRMELLVQMDSYARDNFDEDIVIDVWLATGLEDGWDDNILRDYAEDDDLWTDCCKTFNICRIEQEDRDFYEA